MTAFDDEMRDLAVELIDEEFGGAMTYTDLSYAAYDPTTSSAAEVTVDIAGKMSPPFPFKEMQIDGDLVRIKDLQTLLAARDLTFTPTINDEITFDGTTYKVLRSNPIYSGDEVAAWHLHLRGP